MLAMIMVFIAYSLLRGSIEVIRFYKVHTAKNLCDLLFSGILCYPLLTLSLACSVITTTIHLSIVIERAIASKYLYTYENHKSVCGYVLAALSIVAGVSISTFAMSGTDLIKDTPCRKDTSEKETFAVLISRYIVLFLEATIIISFCCVYYVNSKKSNNFDIRGQYQSKENLAVLRLLMPQIIFHNAIYLVLILLEITTRSVRRYFTIDIAMVANIIGACAVSIYNICSPLLLWCILQRQKARRTRAIELLSKKVAHQDDIYFSKYAWNN